MLQKSVLFFILIAASLSLPFAVKRLTCGFKIQKLLIDLPLKADWEPEISEEIREILAQPFEYLGRGAQCYAFSSQDGRHVLKLLRFDRGQKGRVAPALLEACRIAFQVAKEETGLIYLHWNPTQGALPVAQARGPLGRPVSLPLDSLRFALQWKATPALEGLEAAKKEGTLPARIGEIVSRLESRIGKRIGNSDPNLFRNFGFLKDRAIEIDFGNFCERPDFSEKQNARAELERYVKTLRFWLEQNAPEELAPLEARIGRAFQ